MEQYRNLSGESGVSAYSISAQSITIRFRNGYTYIYNYQHPGRAQVEEMKRRALEGRGLATYISTMVGENYASKLD